MNTSTSLPEAFEKRQQTPLTKLHADRINVLFSPIFSKDSILADHKPITRWTKLGWKIDRWRTDFGIWLGSKIAGYSLE